MSAGLLSHSDVVSTIRREWQTEKKVHYRNYHSFFITVSPFYFARWLLLPPSLNSAGNMNQPQKTLRKVGDLEFG